MLKYFSTLSPGKTILWCYLLWYVMIVARYFDATYRIWLNSVGISLIIGFALQLSVRRDADAKDGWQTFRLFLMPFCVSSFASLIKGRGFLLIFPPSLSENATLLAVCLGFVLLTRIARRAYEA